MCVRDSAKPSFYRAASANAIFEKLIGRLASVEVTFH